MLPEILLMQAGSHIGQADRFYHIELFPLNLLSAKGTPLLISIVFIHLRAIHLNICSYIILPNLILLR